MILCMCRVQVAMDDAITGLRTADNKLTSAQLTLDQWKVELSDKEYYVTSCHKSKFFVCVTWMQPCVQHLTY